MSAVTCPDSPHGHVGWPLAGLSPSQELFVLTVLLGYGVGVPGLDASKKAALKRFFPKYTGFHLKGMKQVGGMRSYRTS